MSAGLGFLSEQRIYSASGGVGGVPTKRYLDVPAARPGQLMPQRRRRLIVEPILLPSLTHCNVAVSIDKDCDEYGYMSRKAARRTLQERGSHVLSAAAEVAVAEVQQAVQPMRRREQRSLRPAVPGAGAGASAIILESLSSLRASASAPTLRKGGQPPGVLDASTASLWSDDDTAVRGGRRAGEGVAGDGAAAVSVGADAEGADGAGGADVAVDRAKARRRKPKAADGRKPCLKCLLDLQFGGVGHHTHFKEQVELFGDTVPKAPANASMALSSTASFGVRVPLESLPKTS